ncbi:unnamed protein product, partial [Ectocarpus sp. 12 AP-2014]
SGSSIIRNLPATKEKNIFKLTHVCHHVEPRLSNNIHTFKSVRAIERMKYYHTIGIHKVLPASRRTCRIHVEKNTAPPHSLAVRFGVLHLHVALTQSTSQNMYTLKKTRKHSPGFLKTIREN